MADQQQDTEKPTTKKERTHKIRDSSPYSKSFKCYVRSDEKDLIYKRQTVTKLSRKDLEDKYIELCDENFFNKRQLNELQDKIKELTTKIGRLSCGHRCYSSSAILRERTSENIADTVKYDIHMHSCCSKPMARSSSLNTVYRNTRSATPSERSNSSSSSNSSHRSIEGNTKDESPVSKIKDISDVLEKDQQVNEKLKILQSKIDELTAQIKVEGEKEQMNQTGTEKAECSICNAGIKKCMSESVEITRLKRVLEQIRGMVKRMQVRYKEDISERDEQIATERKQFNTKLEQMLEENLQKPPQDERKTDLKMAQRTIEMLRKEVAELESDKKKLLEQQDQLSELLKKAATSSKEIPPPPPPALSEDNLLGDTLTKLKTDKAAAENSKTELLNRIKELQDFNDKLAIDLEGFKAMSGFLGETRCIGNEEDDLLVLVSEEVRYCQH